MTEIWTHALGDAPIVAMAIHAGHALRDEFARLEGRQSEDVQERVVIAQRKYVGRLIAGHRVCRATD